MNEIKLLNTNETAKAEQNWMSKQELMDICKCSKDSLERIIADLSTRTGAATQNHIKKGGYHNSEVFYDDYLVRLIQAKLLSNKVNQGNSSDTIKEIVKSGETNWYSVKEICDICNTSRQTWINFKNEFNCKTGFTVKRNLRVGDKNIDYYPEDILKTFQAWLLRNQTNQGNSSDQVKELVATAVKNKLTKTLSKEELRIELARNKTLQLQSKAQIESSKAQIESSKAQKQIVTEQERTKREQIRYDKEEIILKRKEVETELLRQKNISKALKIKQFTDPLKQELKSMTNELAQQVVQAEYTKKLKQLDADGKYMLYIFHNPTNPTIYKIGKSNSLGNRLAIGTSENPNLQILYKRYCSCQMACDELEDTIHQELREYNYKLYSETGSKEWFVLTKEKLNEIVNKYQFVEVN